MTWKAAYLESQVLSADPIELVRILYQIALDSVQEARRHLAAGDIAARSKAIGQAISALSELNAALDHSNGGAISRNLEELYRYLRQRLTEANLRQQDGPLAEAGSLLTTLSDAWKGVRSEPAAEPAVAVPLPEPRAMAWQETGYGGSHTWSA